MLKAVLFDLDGTLLDRDDLVNGLITAQHERFSALLSHIPVADYLRHFIALDQRGYTPKTQVYPQLLRELSLPEHHWEALFADYLAHYHQYSVGFPDMLAMLTTLHESGLRLGIITNGRGDLQTNAIRALEIENFFDVILISEVEGLRKPDSRIFQRALERLDVGADEAVFVGDHPDTDVGGALNAGLKAIWKRDAHWPPPAYADGIVDDLMTLPTSIAALSGNPSPSSGVSF